MCLVYKTEGRSRRRRNQSHIDLLVRKLRIPYALHFGNRLGGDVRSFNRPELVVCQTGHVASMVKAVNVDTYHIVTRIEVDAVLVRHVVLVEDHSVDVDSVVIGVATGRTEGHPLERREQERLDLLHQLLVESLDFG